MKSLMVVGAFVDKRTGVRIEPGQPVPAGLGEDAVRRLVKAGCLVEDQTPSGLFGEAALEAPRPETFPAAGRTPLAGRDGAASGKRAEPGEARRGARKGQGPRDRGQ